MQWVTESAGADGPIYSAHVRCSSPSAPQETSDRGELSAGPDFKDLKSYRLCQPN
jgi:hypothetical protein